MEPVAAVWPQGRFDGRLVWPGLLHQALDLALQQRVRHLVWCDPDFVDWPLGERLFNERLNAWAHAGGQLSLLALDYRRLVQVHARFVQWRTTWSHRVEARAAPRELQDGFPTLVCHSGWAAQRTTSAQPAVLAFTEPARVQGLMGQWQSLWDRSAPAFPATTLGL